MGGWLVLLAVFAIGVFTGPMVMRLFGRTQ